MDTRIFPSHISFYIRSFVPLAEECYSKAYWQLENKTSITVIKIRLFNIFIRKQPYTKEEGINLRGTCLDNRAVAASQRCCFLSRTVAIIKRFMRTVQHKKHFLVLVTLNQKSIGRFHITVQNNSHKQNTP